MYLLNETEQHVHTSLRDAILLLCQTGLKFNTELSVDGLLAVTVDKQHVYLISIKETVHANKPCGTNDNTACIHTSDSQAEAVVNVSSACPSTVTSVSFDGQSLSSGYEEECTGNVTSLRLPSKIPSQCNDAIRSDHTCRARHRKQQHTVRRFVDASCRSTSMSLELLSQPELISDWVGSENREIPIVGDDHEDKQCNHACKSDLPSDIANQHTAIAEAVAVSSAASDHTFSDCADQKCGEMISSLTLLTKEQEQCQIDMLINPPVTPASNTELVADCEHMSKRSHRKRRRTVRRYLDHSASRKTSSVAMSLTSLSQTDHSHIPGWVDNVNGEASTLNKVPDDHCGHGCKMNMSNSNSSAAAEAECQNMSASCLSANVKSEIVEPSSTSQDIISQLASVGHNMRPPCDPQQQMALMSQFCLPAVVSAARQSVTGSWQLFPWTSPTLPQVECGIAALHLLL